MKYYYLSEAGDVLAEADTIEQCREQGRAEAQRLTGAWHPSQGYIITDGDGVSAIKARSCPSQGESRPCEGVRVYEGVSVSVR